MWKLYYRVKRAWAVLTGNATATYNKEKITSFRNIPYTKKEIDLLWTLANHPQKAYTREELLNLLWGFDYFGDTRTVDSHIKRLRGKLGKQIHPNWAIKTIWGVGYKFEVISHEK